MYISVGSSAWGWGSSSGSSGFYDVSITGDQYGDDPIWVGIGAAVQSATVGNDVILTITTNIPGWALRPETGAYVMGVQYYFEDVSAQGGVDYTNSATTWDHKPVEFVSIGANSADVHIHTINHALSQARLSFAIHVRAGGHEESEFVIEADINE